MIVSLQIGNLNFIYSEKVTKFWEISTVDLSYVVPVIFRVEILQNFVAFSEYMNFNNLEFQQFSILAVYQLSNYQFLTILATFNLGNFNFGNFKF